MAFPRFTREEVRNKLGILADEKLVLVPGGKLAGGNMVLLSMVIDALVSLTRRGGRFRLIFCVHPGDRTPYAVDSLTHKGIDFYEELLSLSSIPSMVVSKNVFTTSDMVPGADIVAEFGSSIGIESAYCDIPVISFGTEVSFCHHEQTNGTRTLEIVVSELVISGVNSLTEVIQRLLTPKGFAVMRARQLEVCQPPVERGTALRKIADALVEII